MMAMLKMIFTALFLLVAVTTHVVGVYITRLYVPSQASHEAFLICHYDLEENELYVAKWFKDGVQFYSCEPTGETHKYELEGAQIQNKNVAPVGSCSLTLMLLNYKSTGEYQCEVTTEGPEYKTAIASQKLTFVEDVPVMDSASLYTNFKLLICVPFIIIYSILL